MIKRIISAILGTLAVVLIVARVSAQVPTVTIDPIGALEYAVFPHLYTVTGTLSMNAPDDTSDIDTLRLFINDVQEGATVFTSYPANSSVPYSMPWNITAPGTYNVKVVAVDQTVSGPDRGISEEVVAVAEGTVVIGQCPAAPGIAAKYLQQLGIKSGSKLYKNVVSLVAQHMAPTTDFDGVEACEVDYETVVKAYVDAHMTVTK